MENSDNSLTLAMTIAPIRPAGSLGAGPKVEYARLSHSVTLLKMVENSQARHGATSQTTNDPRIEVSVCRDCQQLWL